MKQEALGVIPRIPRIHPWEKSNRVQGTYAVILCQQTASKPRVPCGDQGFGHLAEGSAADRQIQAHGLAAAAGALRERNGDADVFLLARPEFNLDFLALPALRGNQPDAGLLRRREGIEDPALELGKPSFGQVELVGLELAALGFGAEVDIVVVQGHQALVDFMTLRAP